MTIVIVDDSKVNLIVLKNMVRSNCPSTILTFASSIEALEHLACNAAELVIVDWDMPDLNGVKFIEEMRRHRHHNDTPIVMVTSYSGDNVRREALAVGATDFLSKPFDAGEFKVRIRNLLRLTARPAPAAIKPPVPSSSTAPFGNAVKAR